MPRSICVSVCSTTMVDYHSVFIAPLHIVFAAQFYLYIMNRTAQPRGVKVHGVGEALCKGFVKVQRSKPPEVVTATADALDEHGFKEEAAQLRGQFILSLYCLITIECLHAIIVVYY